MMQQAEFIHDFSIMKAFPMPRGNGIRILIKASTEKEDRVGEVILKSAYADTQMRSNFLDEGYLDYNHLTDIIDKEIINSGGNISPERLTELQKSKIQAIIGYPQAVGTRDEFPSEYKLVDDGFYILGSLIPGNVYAEEIRKGLEAGFAGWGASVSGKAHRSDFDGNTLKRIHLRKCAIQPKSDSINNDTAVTLMKSNILMLKDVQKSFLASQDSSFVEESNIEDLSFLRKLQVKYNALYDFVSNDPIASQRYMEKIFSDIVSRVISKEMSVKTISIRDWISSQYGLEGDLLEEMTDTFFIKLNGEINV
jgi:hypothetical protein